MLRSTIISHAEDNKVRSKLRFKQLQDLETEVPWDELSEVIAPHYLASSIGRLLVPTETMLRVFFLQLRYSMSASGVEEALFQIKVLRDFALIDMDTDVIPNEACIESFHSLILEYNLKPMIDEAFGIDPIVVVQEV